jgi:hypothetical protein
MEQCVDHAEKLSKSRRHIFEKTCLFDGEKAAAFVLEREPDQNERYAEAEAHETSRALRLMRARMLTIERNVPTVAIESVFMRGRTRWLDSVCDDLTLENLRNKALELVQAVIPANLTSYDVEQPEAIEHFCSVMRTCTSPAHAAGFLADILGLDAPAGRSGR